MIYANKMLTVIHHSKHPDGDSYNCWHFTGSWYSQIKTAVGTNGLQAASLVKCRIPIWGLGAVDLDRLSAIRPGDKVLQGTLSSCDSAAFAALGRTRGAMTVIAVHDNSDGPQLHFYLEGAE